MCTAHTASELWSQTKASSVWPSLLVKITRCKNLVWIGIFKPAELHSLWAACYVSFLLLLLLTLLSFTNNTIHNTVNNFDWRCCWNSETIQLLPKTPTKKRQLQQRGTGRAYDGAANKITAGQQLTKNSADKRSDSHQAAESADCCPDHVLEKITPGRDDEQCLACFHHRSSLVASSSCTGHRAADGTSTSLFPELRDRYLVNDSASICLCEQM